MTVEVVYVTPVVIDVVLPVDDVVVGQGSVQIIMQITNIRHNWKGCIQ